MLQNQKFGYLFIVVLAFFSPQLVLADAPDSDSGSIQPGTVINGSGSDFYTTYQMPGLDCTDEEVKREAGSLCHDGIYSGPRTCYAIDKNQNVYLVDAPNVPCQPDISIGRNDLKPVPKRLLDVNSVAANGNGCHALPLSQYGKLQVGDVTELSSNISKDNYCLSKAWFFGESPDNGNMYFVTFAKDEASTGCKNQAQISVQNVNILKDSKNPKWPGVLEKLERVKMETLCMDKIKDPPPVMAPPAPKPVVQAEAPVPDVKAPPVVQAPPRVETKVEIRNNYKCSEFAGVSVPEMPNHVREVGCDDLQSDDFQRKCLFARFCNPKKCEIKQCADLYNNIMSSDILALIEAQTATKKKLEEAKSKNSRLNIACKSETDPKVVEENQKKKTILVRNLMAATLAYKKANDALYSALIAKLKLNDAGGCLQFDIASKVQEAEAQRKAKKRTEPADYVVQEFIPIYQSFKKIYNEALPQAISQKCGPAKAAAPAEGASGVRR